ncbi:N/A [soil metagenome]
MHVILFCRSFPHHRPGGMEWHAQDVAEGLMAAGHTLSAITTPLPATPALRELKLNGRILVIGRKPGRYDASMMFSGPAIRKFLSQTKPDIVHCQGFAGILAQRTIPRGQPVCTSIHGTLFSETSMRPWSQSPTQAPLGIARANWKRLAGLPVWKKFLCSQPQLIVDSAFTREELLRENGIALEHVAVVPLGFDLARFPLSDRQASRSKWMGSFAPRVDGVTSSRPFIIVSVSRLEPIKRPQWILDAFVKCAARFPNAYLIMAGEGSVLASLRATVTASGVQNRIAMPGKVGAADLPGLLESADLFVNADHGAPAFGLANAEALVMGAPVLAVDTGAHREVILGGEDGVLTPPDNQPAFVSAMSSQIATLSEGDPHRSDRMEKARGRFARALMNSKLLRAYENAIRSKPL